MKQIQKNGTIEVLRNGFRDIAKFDLFYAKPNNDLNPELKAKFNQNIFSVIDELEYQNKELNMFNVLHLLSKFLYLFRFDISNQIFNLFWCLKRFYK